MANKPRTKRNRNRRRRENWRAVLKDLATMLELAGPYEAVDFGSLRRCRGCGKKDVCGFTDWGRANFCVRCLRGMGVCVSKKEFFKQAITQAIDRNPGFDAFRHWNSGP